MTKQAEVLGNPKYKPVLDHGFVGLVAHMGDDAAVVQAARVSYGDGTKTVLEDRGLIRYLMRHKHTSPFEMCQIKIHIKMPIFVMRQWVRHRTASLNEYSGRYSVMTDEFYMPEPEMIMPQSKDNKQGRAGSMNASNATGVRWMMDTAYQQSYDIYKVLLGEGREMDEAPYDPFDESDPLFDQDFNGIAREMARSVLPVGNYTELYWTQNLHNMMHLLKLRMDPHAQYEIRAFADAVYDLIKPLFPDSLQAFDDYVREAASLSRMEVDLMRQLLGRLPRDTYYNMVMEHTAKSEISWAKSLGLSPRELREFEEKWNQSPEPSVPTYDPNAPRCPDCHYRPYERSELNPDYDGGTVKASSGDLKIKRGTAGKRLALGEPGPLPGDPKAKATRKPAARKAAPRKKVEPLKEGHVRKGGVNKLPNPRPERPAPPAPMHSSHLDGVGRLDNMAPGGAPFAPDGSPMGWVGNEWLPVGAPAKSTKAPRVPRKK